MELCSVCGKPRAFSFSPKLLRCLLCNKLYHLDCHEPRVEDYKLEFECSECRPAEDEGERTRHLGGRDFLGERSFYEVRNPAVRHLENSHDDVRDHAVSKKRRTSFLRNGFAKKPRLANVGMNPRQAPATAGPFGTCKPVRTLSGCSKGNSLSKSPRSPSVATANASSHQLSLKATAPCSCFDTRAAEFRQLNDENSILKGRIKGLESNLEDGKGRFDRAVKRNQDLEKSNGDLATELISLRHEISAFENSKQEHARTVDELRRRNQASVRHIEELQRKLNVGDAEQKQESSLIDVLRLRVAGLKEQLSSQKTKHNFKQFLEIPASQMDQSNLVRSQAEPLTPNSILSAAVINSRAVSVIPDNTATEDQLQAELFKARMSLFEKEQTITRLERELEEVKVGMAIRVTRIAHTSLTDGAPTGIMEAIERVELSGLARKPRKQTSKQVAAHQSPDRQMKVKVDPVRWIAREQSRQTFRPKLGSGTAANHTTPHSNHVNQLVRTKTAADSNSSPAERLDGEDSEYLAEDEVDEGRTISVPGHGTGKTKNTLCEHEIPNSSTDAGSNNSEVATTSPDHPSPAGSKQVRAEVHRGSQDSSSRYSPPKVLPEAASAYRGFERDFALEPGAVPGVAGTQLVFRTAPNDSRSRRARKSAPNHIYRVGRDVVRELR